MRALERSMKLLRKEGLIVAKAEHWNSFAKIRQDLFGFIDAVALSDKYIYAIQCVNTHLPEHIIKIHKNQAADVWLSCGGKIVIHNWKQRSKNKKKSWHLEIIEITKEYLRDFKETHKELYEEMDSPAGTVNDGNPG